MTSNSTRKPKHINFSGMIWPPFVAVFIALLVIFPSDALKAASKGLDLWFSIVLPSLFPFFVAADLLNRTYIPAKAGMLLEPLMKPLFNIPGPGSFAFILGVSSGYPVGAKITESLHRNRLLDDIESERLLSFSNNSGPVFIAGAIGAGMFGMPGAGLLLLGCHIAAGIAVGLIFRFYRKSPVQGTKPAKYDRHDPHAKTLIHNGHIVNIGTSALQSFTEAVKNSIVTISAIGGYIILFSVIIEMLIKTGFISKTASLLSAISGHIGAPLPSDLFVGILGGVFEITNGVGLIAASEASLQARLIAAGIVAGWGGFSVHAQVLGIISGTGLKLKPYLAGKLLHSLIAGLFTAVALCIAKPIPDWEALAVFSGNRWNTVSIWFDMLLSSILLSTVMAGLTAVMESIYGLIKRKRRSI